jgi:hypothetical protein
MSAAEELIQGLTALAEAYRDLLALEERRLEVSLTGDRVEAETLLVLEERRTEEARERLYAVRERLAGQSLGELLSTAEDGDRRRTKKAVAELIRTVEQLRVTLTRTGRYYATTTRFVQAFLQHFPSVSGCYGQDGVIPPTGSNGSANVRV